MAPTVTKPYCPVLFCFCLFLTFFNFRSFIYDLILFVYLFTYLFGVDVGLEIDDFTYLVKTTADAFFNFFFFFLVSNASKFSF